MSTTILTIVRPLQYYHNHTSRDGHTECHASADNAIPLRHRDREPQIIRGIARRPVWGRGTVTASATRRSLPRCDRRNRCGWCPQRVMCNEAMAAVRQVRQEPTQRSGVVKRRILLVARHRIGMARQSEAEIC